MKKFLSVFIMITALSMSACGTSEQQTQAQTSENITKTAVVVEEEKENAAEGSEKAVVSADNSVIYDKDGIKITVSEVKLSEEYAEMDITFENNTDDEVHFSGTKYFAVNGYSVPFTLFSSVEAGNSDTETVSFGKFVFDKFGFTDIADVEFIITANDSSYNTIFEELFRIETDKHDSYDYDTDTYLEQLKAGISPKYGYETADLSEDKIYDGGGFSIISETIFKTENGNSLWLEAVNNSEDTVYVVIPDIFINGVYTSESEDIYLPAGRKKIIEIDTEYIFPYDTFELLGYDGLENIGLSCAVYDKDYNSISEGKAITLDYSDKKTPVDTSGDEVYNNDGVRIISKGIAKDPEGEDGVLLFLVENKNDEEIYIGDDYDGTIMLNGKEEYFVIGASVPAGEYGLLTVEISEYDLKVKEVGLTSIDDLKSFIADICVYGDNIDSKGRIEVNY